MKKITLLFILVFTTNFVFSQNTCATAVPITAAGTFVITAINGTQVIPSACIGDGLGTAAEWYAYTPTQNYTVTVTTDLQINICRDTRFQVYTGTCGTLTCFTGDDDSGIIACNSGNSNTYLSVKTFDVVSGTTYYIAFDNKWESTGFSFQLIETPFVAPPPSPVTFTNQTISTINSTYNLCVVDMNGDYRDDIVGVNTSSVRLHTQNVGGGFTMTDIPTTAADFLPSWSLAAGDYNKDGFNDLLYGNGSGLTFMKSNSTGTAFTEDSPGQYIFCQRTNFIDINNDGNLDAFSCHDVDPNVYYLNNGTGNFTYYQSGITPGALSLGISSNGGNYGSIWVDYDNDRDLDLFIAKCGSVPPDELHRNNGNGTFSDISVEMNMYDAGQSWSAAWADYDNDGDMDALVGASAGAHKLKKNNLNTANSVEEPFTDVTAGSGWDTNTSVNIEHIAYDFDNDGWIDFMGGGNKIMFNQGGNGTFVPVSVGFGVGAVGDLNNDGFLDIQTGNTLRISNGNSNRWIKIQLQGVQSNRNGIGARVEIYGAWGKQIRDVRSGEGFKYMSTLNTHFGIGQATEITQVIIRWPSGTIDVINNPTVNQSLFVLEGSSPLATASFENSEITLYPNPARDVLSIKLPATLEIASAKIFDISGRLVLEPKATNETFSVQELSVGTYVLLLKDTTGRVYSQKFIKE
jgi:hypothetical protein